MLFSLLFWVKVSEIRLSAKDYNVIIFQSVSLLVPLHAGIWFSRLFQSYWPLNELYTTNPIHPFTHIHTALYSVLLMLSKALFSPSHMATRVADLESPIHQTHLSLNCGRNAHMLHAETLQESLSQQCELLLYFHFFTLTAWSLFLD